MTPHPLTDHEIDALARQVDEQLTALPKDTGPIFRGSRRAVPFAPEQEEYLAQATQEPFETFWQKYLRHARRDLCLPNGQLYKSWQQLRALSSKDAVKVSLAFLAGIGISSSVLAPAVVAAAVCLLNVVTTIGIDAICEGCAEDELVRIQGTKTDGPKDA